MAMSRTARILVAILLLAAAAFFWVNFYTQSRTAETPTPTDPIAADDPAGPAALEAADAAAADGVDDVAGDVVGDVVQGDGAAAPATEDAAPTPDAAAAEAIEPAEDASPDAEVDVDADAEPAIVVAPADAGPPTVVVDAPVVGREIVIADLPFLVTEPRPTEVDAAETDVVDGEQALGVTTPTRATVNPFSPVVVRTPPAPERDVPDTASVVGEVAVPTAPTPAEVAAAAAAARASAPTPRAVTPGSSGGTSALRPLPTGSVLSSTPELLREPRVGSAAEEVDFATVTAIAVPDAEPANLAANAAEPAQAEAPDQVEPIAALENEVPPTADAPTPSPTPSPTPPLAAGATELARFLRDQNYAFTGSVVGPVGVGVFRSDLDPAPVVVVLGQTLPDTEIVLTDLRGQQAELRLGDSKQILTLDLRR